MVDLNSSQYSQVTKIYRTVNKEKAAEVDEESNIKVKIAQSAMLYIYLKKAKRRPTKKTEENAVIDKEKTDNETMRLTTVMYSRTSISSLILFVY